MHLRQFVMETAFLAKSDLVKSDICALVVTNNELQITIVKRVDHIVLLTNQPKVQLEKISRVHQMRKSLGSRASTPDPDRGTYRPLIGQRVWLLSQKPTHLWPFWPQAAILQALLCWSPGMEKSVLGIQGARRHEQRGQVPPPP